MEPYYQLYSDTDNTCHGTFDTLDEARAAASFDHLTEWTVYYNDQIVARRGQSENYREAVSA